MKLDNKELLERLSTSRKAFNATAFAELDRRKGRRKNALSNWTAICLMMSAKNGTQFMLHSRPVRC